MNPKTHTTTIKCGNGDHGVYLLDDIKERLNTRYLTGSISVIDDITYDGLTWVTIHITIKDDFTDALVNKTLVYIKGLVAGIMIWSGVEVI